VHRERNSARVLGEADTTLLGRIIDISCERAPMEEAAQLLI
jgi:hypothetical protein